MTDTIITVQGRFSSFYPPERATVQLSVGFEGADREPVYSETVAASSTVRALIAEHHSPGAGPITWWSSDSIQVWSSKPWNQDGMQLPAVYHSRIGFSVKFSDFAALVTWIDTIAAIDGVTVEDLSWAALASSTETMRGRCGPCAVAPPPIHDERVA